MLPLRTNVNCGSDTCDGVAAGVATKATEATRAHARRKVTDNTTQNSTTRLPIFNPDSRERATPADRVAHVGYFSRDDGRNGHVPKSHEHRERAFVQARRVPHFALVTRDGEMLAAVEFAGENWAAGNVIYRGGYEPNLLVVDRLAGDDPEVFDALVVEPA